MNTKALLIEWDPPTAKRAGNIDPRDPGLWCNGWQNMDSTPAIELKLIQDSRDIEQYKSIDGITVLCGTNQINKAIEEHFPSQFSIEDETIYRANVNSVAHLINFHDLPDNHEKRLKFLKKHFDIKGIKEIKPQKV